VYEPEYEPIDAWHVWHVVVPVVVHAGDGAVPWQYVPAHVLADAFHPSSGFPLLSHFASIATFRKPFTWYPYPVTGLIDGLCNVLSIVRVWHDQHAMFPDRCFPCAPVVRVPTSEPWHVLHVTPTVLSQRTVLSRGHCDGVLNAALSVPLLWQYTLLQRYVPLS
jgi:hypothetical protein